MRRRPIHAAGASSLRIPDAHFRLSAGLAATLGAAFCLSLLVATPAAAQIGWVNRVADGNRVGLTVTNYGYIGSNFLGRVASLEFPLGSGFEHLTHGGLWIGGQSADLNGVFTGVTTAALDGSVAQSTVSASEFTPTGNAIVVRSTNSNSVYYSPLAVSDLDCVSTFSDTLVKRADYNNELHRPLRLRVRQESYQFTNPVIQDVLFLRYVITAMGPPVSNVWVGLYTEFASGNKTAAPTWPPTGWYYKKWLQYDPQQRLVREHYCQARPVPFACQLQNVPYWVGAAVLTPPDSTRGQGVTLSAWPYGPGSPYRNEDVERYALMSTGVAQSLAGDSLQPTTGDPIELLAIGPFATIATGDSVVIDFALVGGAEVADIQAAAANAQQFHASGFDLATPAQVALAAARAETGRVALDWYSGTRIGDMTVERSHGGGAWGAIATISADGAGHLRYDDRDVIAGGRYGYRLVADGATFGETWVTVPAAELALFGAGANPARAGELSVEFALGSSMPARLEMFDAAGRRLAARSVGGLGAGRHAIGIASRSGVQSGVYFLRLIQGGRAVGSRVIVLE